MSEQYSGGEPQNLPAQIGNMPEGRPLVFMGKPVMTTEMLAGSFEASPKNILDNFQNNGVRFAEGVTHHRLAGDELKAFKDYPDNIGVVPKHAPSLILWTQRGVARHAKVLDTDAAWQVYEQLEETYFAVQEGRIVARALSPAEMFLQNAQAMVEIERRQEEQGRAISIIGDAVARVEQAQTILKHRTAGSEGITHIRPRLNNMLGLSAVTVDAVMRTVSYSPRVAGMVENSHVDALETTYAVYWQKDVTKCFRQFAGECTQVTATMWTHPQIEGRFKMALPKSEIH